MKDFVTEAAKASIQELLNTIPDSPKDMLVMKRKYFPDATTSNMTGFSGGKKVVSIYSTELPWRDNKNDISCIPEGAYPCHKWNSPTHGPCFRVENVPGRDAILVHIGNFVYGEKVESRGCILPAVSLGDINKDGHIDGVSSKTAMSELLKEMPEKFDLVIYSD